MCLRPVTIKTNRNNYRVGIDKMYMQVPCGDCEECRLMRINDYYVRLHYEWQRYMNNGGSVFFITMSHNNQSLPFTPSVDSLEFNVCADNLQNKGLIFSENFAQLPCFDKSAVRSFLERLHHLDRFPRQILRGIQYYAKDETGTYVPQQSCFCDNDGVLRNPVLGTDIKHFVVCEYGKETKRPHYHALIFFPFIVQAGNFKRLCEFAWSTLYAESEVPEGIAESAHLAFDDGKDFVEFQDWFAYRSGVKRKKTFFMHKNGFVMYSKKGAQMTRPLGMKYLCKYLFKDTEYLKVPFVPEYIDIIKELPTLAHMPESEAKRCLKRYKDSVPFFLISNGVGTLFEKEVDIDTVEGAKEFARKEFHFDNDGNIYAMPKYFVRRLLYQNRHYTKLDDDYKHVTICYLTEFGRNVLREKFFDSVDRFVDKVRMVSTSSFKSLLYPLDFEFGSIGCEVPFDLNAFYSELYDNYLSIPKLRLLAYYKLIFQNVAIPDNLIDADCMNSEDLFKLGNKIFDNKLATQNEHEHEIFSVGNKEFIRLHTKDVDFKRRLYNHLDIFKGFDIFLSEIQFVYNLVHDRNYKEAAKRYEENMKYRSLYNSIIYKNAV